MRDRLGLGLGSGSGLGLGSGSGLGVEEADPVGAGVSNALHLQVAGRVVRPWLRARLLRLELGGHLP